MATIGTIATNVVMRTAPFEQGAKRVVTATKGMISGVSPLGKNLGSLASQFGGVGGSMGSILSAAGPVAAGIAAVGVAAGAAYMAINKISEAMKRIDETATSARNLGVPIEKFIAYEHAAKKAEIGSGGFAVAIKKMENAAADAAEGTGPAAKAFEKLGISAEKFKALSPDQQLGVMADKLQGVTNQADRASIATDLFGKSGVAMLEFLKDGSAGLALAEEKARLFGGTLSDIDAAKVDAANDAMDDLGFVFDGIWNQLAVALAPAIQDVAESLTAFFVDNMPMIKTFITAIGDLAKWFVQLGKDAIGLAMALNPTWQIIKGLYAMGWGSGDQPTAKAAAKTVDVSRDKKDPISKEMKSQAASLFEATRTPQEQFAKKQEDLNRLLGVGAINQDTFNRALAAAKSELEKATDKDDGFKFDAPRFDFQDPRMGGIASSPGALERGTSEAFNQFIRNQQGTEGDPVRKLMQEQHDEQMEEARALRDAVTRAGAKGAIF